MAKYLSNSAGAIAEVQPVTTSAGAADATKLAQLDGAGRFDNSVLPVGIGADTNPVQASEALAAGDFVNVHDVAGAFRCRKADATVSGKQADGFVLAAVASGANATIYSEGPNTAVTAQTPGQKFLATTAGTATATAPSGAGNVVQRIGVAMSATVINFEPQPPILLV